LLSNWEKAKEDGKETGEYGRVPQGVTGGRVKRGKVLHEAIRYRNRCIMDNIARALADE
jgi:hypothetical protein